MRRKAAAALLCRFRTHFISFLYLLTHIFHAFKRGPFICSRRFRCSYGIRLLCLRLCVTNLPFQVWADSVQCSDLLIYLFPCLFQSAALCLSAITTASCFVLVLSSTVVSFPGVCVDECKRYRVMPPPSIKNLFCYCVLIVRHVHIWHVHNLLGRGRVEEGGQLWLIQSSSVWAA